MRNLGEVPLPENVGDFRLMSRRVLDAVQQLRERHRFMKGLFAWVGFPARFRVLSATARRRRTKWSLWKFWNLAIEGITGFSVAPLKLATYLGLGSAVRRGVRCAAHRAHALFGDEVAGCPSLMAVVLFLGGTQLVTLGIIGEYLGRVFNEPSAGRSIWWSTTRRAASPCWQSCTVTPIMSPSRTMAARLSSVQPSVPPGAAEHHPAIVRGRIDDADLHALGQHRAPFRDQPRGSRTPRAR